LRASQIRGCSSTRSIPLLQTGRCISCFCHSKTGHCKVRSTILQTPHLSTQVFGLLARLCLPCDGELRLRRRSFHVLRQIRTSTPTPFTTIATSKHCISSYDANSDTVIAFFVAFNNHRLDLIAISLTARGNHSKRCRFVFLSIDNNPLHQPVDRFTADLTLYGAGFHRSSINMTGIKGKRVPGRPGRFDPSTPLHMTTRRSAKKPASNKNGGSVQDNSSIEGEASRRASYEEHSATSPYQDDFAQPSPKRQRTESVHSGRGESPTAHSEHLDQSTTSPHILATNN
jgi:hypothetical protein